MSIEQLPLGADLDRLVLFGSKDLGVAAIEDRRETAIGGAGAIEFSAYRVCRRRISDIDAAVRLRLEGEAEIEVRDSEVRRLLAEDGPTTNGAVTGRLDRVIVIANAAIQNDEVMVVGGIEDIAALRVDADVGRPRPKRRRTERKQGVLGRKYVNPAELARTRKGRRAGRDFRTETGVIVDV